MSEQSEARPPRQTHLPHAGQELPGAPPPDACDPQDAQQNAERLIRSLIIEQKRETSPKQLPPLAPAMAVAEARKPAVTEPDVRHNPATRHQADVTEQVTAPPASQLGRAFARMSMPRLSLPKPRLPRLALPRPMCAYRPTRKHVLFALLALVIVLRPLFLPMVAFVAFWLGLIAYLTLGPARCAEMGAGLWSRFAARYPARADRVRQRADAFAERFDRLLDRLPEPLADRLALPDFSASRMDDPDRPDPFDRLARQARDA